MKRIIALLLTIFLCVGLLPSAAFAWYPEEIMDAMASTVEEPRKDSWLDECRTMYVASDYGRLIYIMRAPKKDSKKLGEAAEAEAVTVYAIQKGYALAIVDSTGEGGWMNMDNLVDEYYREGPGPADTLDVKKGVMRPTNDQFFDEYVCFTVKSKNGSSTIVYMGPKTTSGKLTQIKDGESVTGIAECGNSIFVKTKDGTLGWVQSKYLVEEDADIDYYIIDNDDSGSKEKDDSKPNSSKVSAGAELPVAEWTDIVKLYSCDFALLGLRSDGTVLVDPDAVYECDDWDGAVSYREAQEIYGGFEASDIDEAVEEISAWSNVKALYSLEFLGFRGIPVAVTDSGEVLVPKILYKYFENDPECKTALDALGAAENIEQVIFGGYCIYAVEEGGKIHTYPYSENWQADLELENGVDPAEVFSDNDYSCIAEYGGTFVGAKSSDGKLITAGQMDEKIEEAVSKWQNIESLYTFSCMQDMQSGYIDILIGVDNKGKVYAEHGDTGLSYCDYDEEFAEMVCKEISSWNNLKTMKTWACWDGGTAQFVGITDKGQARVYNGYVYSYDDCPIGSFTTVKSVADACFFKRAVVIINTNGKLTVVMQDGSDYKLSASCEKKLASFGDCEYYYAIAKDGTVGYIEYQWDYTE